MNHVQLQLFLQAGASASFFNHKLGCSPIHVAADEGEPDKVLLLLQVFAWKIIGFHQVLQIVSYSNIVEYYVSVLIDIRIKIIKPI